MKLRFKILGVMLLVFAIALPASIQAQTINLNFVTFVPSFHAITKITSKDFREVEDVTSGKLKFTYRGGPEAMPVQSMAMGVQSGAVDMCIVSPDFFGKLVLGMEAIDLSTVPVAQHRKAGLYDYMNSLFNKVGLQFIMVAPKPQGSAFHMYTNKEIKKIEDFKGMSIAGTGIFDDIGPALGMVPVAMQMNEQYSAMERGLISVCRGGYDSVLAFKLFEVAKYIIEPGFGTAPASLFINLKKWQSIPKDLQDKFLDTMYKLAPAAEKAHRKADDGALYLAKRNGMKQIKLQGAEKEKFTKLINDAIYKRSARDSKEITDNIVKMVHK